MFFRPKRQGPPPAMTLEGVLGPNNRLDDARGVPLPSPSAICVASDGRLLAGSGNTVVAIRAWRDELTVWATFDRPVTALCAGPGGLMAVGIESGQVAVCDNSGRTRDGWTAPSDLVSVADCAFLPDGDLAVVDSGYTGGEDILAVAPWDDVSRGRVVAMDQSGKSRTLANGLHCPMGICLGADGKPIISLFERAAAVDLSGAVRQSGFPGYPGRIRRTPGGYAMACLARRDPLIEFLKTEPAFVAEMKATIEPRHWISPRATPEFSHDFPIELGATRLFGEVKPWAPSFSYGLVIELDEKLIPVAAAHSRANGRRHAISDVAWWNGEMIAVSQASGELLNLGSEGMSP